MDLSIVIVNFRGWKRLRQCLESLSCLSDAPFTWEVIIVDNQSNDGQLGSFEYEFQHFTFVENTGNNGFANGCNVGAAQSTGTFLLFLNPDTIANLHALKKLMVTALKNPDLTILTCHQLNDKGKDTKPYGLFVRPGTLTSLFRSVYRLTHNHLPQIQLQSGEKALSPEWVSGSAIFIKRTNFNQLGGWCEDYWMYFEDADLCKRVRNTGGQLALLTEISITHNHGGASRINPVTKALTKSEVLISKHVYISKHFSGITRSLMQAYMVVDNLFISHLLISLAGLLLFFVPSINAYTKLYANLVRYYRHAISNKTWLSPRSMSFRQLAKK
ncbi:MAG: glycosyltransferase family 2 protein [Cyclobacteriaceae bacterium]|nr:glycosyltransferase family 2 protein [Cyclobacteriaceae bacterium]UYN88348.1 MAG: glycosyltransferase family 2 protein [Cyclobacteriaceae bacterium]